MIPSVVTPRESLVAETGVDVITTRNDGVVTERDHGVWRTSSGVDTSQDLLLLLTVCQIRLALLVLREVVLVIICHLLPASVGEK